MLYDIHEVPGETGPWRSDQLSELPCIRPGNRVIASQLGSWTELMPGCWVENCVIDDYSYLAGDVDAIHARIGRFCSIASHVRINPGNHPMERVTQHHCTYRRRQYGFADQDDTEFFAWRAAQPVVIGHDVWIGHGAIIMPGITIGHGAVIGSAAVVTKDVPDYAIAVGVPARVIRQRFPAATAAALLRIAWWDWDRATLCRRHAELQDLATFIQRYDQQP